MCRSLVDINWHDPSHAISAFVTIMLMPLTYSISYGLIGGFMAWYSMQAVFFIMRLVFKVERRVATAPYSGTIEEERQGEEIPTAPPANKSTENLKVASMNQVPRQNGTEMDDVELCVSAKAA
jgi:hypothetical protein